MLSTSSLSHRIGELELPAKPIFLGSGKIRANEPYRRCIKRWSERYNRVPKSERKEIAKQIITDLEEDEFRFVKIVKNKESGIVHYIDANEDQKLTKVMQALRDLGRAKKKPHKESCLPSIPLPINDHASSVFGRIGYVPVVMDGPDLVNVFGDTTISTNRDSSNEQQLHS
mmetsp:Transcript_12591/g.19161  ORF Transcript_12591/g.19161 Transcript_12591/m.19161 type:complete len:171 (+) Transcript_12591:597-1109(+)